MMFKKTLLLALLVNLLFLSLYFVFGQVRHGSLDDYFMSSVLTGAYGGEYDVHMYFVNSAYGYFLKPFYYLFPKVGWYFIFELLGTFVAFTSVTYFIIRRLGNKFGLAFSAVLLAALTPDFYFQLSFTQCATAYTAAGIVTISFGISDCKKKFFVIGGFFLLVGSIMRYEGFLLGLPFLALLLIVQLYEKRRIPFVALAALFIAFASIWAVREYDRSLYSSGEYKYYADYQPMRAYFGDGAFYDKESTFDELEERGMSGMDFYMLKSWMFYDTEVFQIDSLKSVRKIAQNNLYRPNPKRMIVEFFFSISKALSRCCGWCWVLCCLLLMLSPSKKANLYPWVSFGVIAVCIGYLLLINRLVYHVESGIWLYAIVTAIPFMYKDIFIANEFIIKNEKAFFCGISFLVVAFAFVGISNQDSLKRHFSLIESPELSKDWADFFEYAKENDTKVFLLSYNRYKELGNIKNPSYVAIAPGDFNNIFSWGYWNIYLPPMIRELEKRGVKNPIRDIVHDNVYLLEDGNRPSLDDFYKEHYHKSLSVDTAKVFGDLLLLKYRLSDEK